MLSRCWPWQEQAVMALSHDWGAGLAGCTDKTWVDSHLHPLIKGCQHNLGYVLRFPGSGPTKA